MLPGISGYVWVVWDCGTATASRARSAVTVHREPFSVCQLATHYTVTLSTWCQSSQVAPTPTQQQATKKHGASGPETENRKPDQRQATHTPHTLHLLCVMPHAPAPVASCSTTGTALEGGAPRASSCYMKVRKKLVDSAGCAMASAGLSLSLPSVERSLVTRSSMSAARAWPTLQ